VSWYFGFLQRVTLKLLQHRSHDDLRQQPLDDDLTPNLRATLDGIHGHDGLLAS